MRTLTFAALACAALAAASVPRIGAASAAAAVTPRIHAMPVIQDARVPSGPDGDCVLPVVIAVACVGAGTPMRYSGGAVNTHPGVYIVFWGWHGQDPSGEAAYQKRFFEGVGGSAWNSSQTQYCNSATANLVCPKGAKHVGNQTGVLLGTWADNRNPVPWQPTDLDIQAEASRAASHFHRSTIAANANIQYVIDTPEGNSTNGFGTKWCAYHGYFTSTYGGLSYTNFPYITDGGASCGEDFVNKGSIGILDGVSIVAGHEFAESETDVAPSSGWTDAVGAETGDKCAWITVGPGAAADVHLSTGTFAVQSLWSNAALGCTLT